MGTSEDRLSMKLWLALLPLAAAESPADPQWHTITPKEGERLNKLDREIQIGDRVGDSYKDSDMHGNRTIRSSRPVVWPCTMCECLTNDELEYKYGPGFGLSSGELKLHLRQNWDGCNGKECDSPLPCLHYDEKNGFQIPDARYEPTFCMTKFGADPSIVNDHAENVEGRKHFCGEKAPCQTSCPNNATIEATKDLQYYVPGARLNKDWETEDFKLMTQRYLVDVANRNSMVKKWFDKQDEDPAGLKKVNMDQRRMPPYERDYKAPDNKKK